ncbi:MAG: glycogen synthase [Planctomycetia bacterium]|nr:glycogen synthase [Planctomycetia bacterium]
MHVVLATAEAAPLAQTGILGDVCASLATELHRAGHHASIVMPAFRSALESGLEIARTEAELSVAIGSKNVTGRLLRSRLPQADVPVYLIEQDDYFNRPGLYLDRDGRDYKDNCERFTFFCRAAMQALPHLEPEVDVLHAHDWPAGLMPAYLAAEFRHLPGYGQIVSLFTVHHAAMQGNFWHWDMLLTGLDWKYFNWQQMEFFGNLSLLKTGIVFADAVTTVSPTYAQEIQSAPLGCGLEGVFRHRRDVLAGICHGIDDRLWDPKTSPHLPAGFSADDPSGKERCKAAVQPELGLPARADVPLVALAGPMSKEAGSDLAAALIAQWCESFDVQWAIVPSAVGQYGRQFDELAQQHAQRVAVRNAAPDLLHRVLAGSDLLLLPSRCEPCGQLQLCAMRYGAVPVARATGGLIDTIADAAPAALAEGTATGFLFPDDSVTSIAQALKRACTMYRQDARTWRSLVTAGMSRDSSWRRSAQKYIDVYTRTLAQRRQEVAI